MLRYESLMLLIPEVTQDEISTLEKEVEKVVKKVQGSVISFEKWGKYRLCYPVRKNDYGVYALVRFELEKSSGEAIKEIDTLLKVKAHETVMRHTVVRLDENASLVYQRPQSLEETPAQDVDSFLKENKMDGLLPGRRRGQRSANTDLDVDDNFDENMSMEDEDGGVA